MPAQMPLQDPLRIAMIEGEVVLLGEGAVNFSMTERAARQTLRNLADALRPDAHTLMIVLVVEDEPVIRELSVVVLEEAGFRVVAAEDAAHALLALETGLHPRVMFTDMQMPGEIDGLQLAHHVRDRWPQIEVLICSGAKIPAPEELPERSRFLRKPYAMDEMVRHVGELAAVGA